MYRNRVHIYRFTLIWTDIKKVYISNFRERERARERERDLNNNSRVIVHDKPVSFIMES